MPRIRISRLEISALGKQDRCTDKPPGIQRR
jgi:hypothetical protein